MQSKVAHAAERKAFGIALDRVIKSASSKDREKNIEHLVNMAGKLMKDTSPGATRGIKKVCIQDQNGRSSFLTLSIPLIHMCLKPLFWMVGMKRRFEGYVIPRQMPRNTSAMYLGLFCLTLQARVINIASDAGQPIMGIA